MKMVAKCGEMTMAQATFLKDRDDMAKVQQVYDACLKRVGTPIYRASDGAEGKIVQVIVQDGCVYVRCRYA